MNTETEIIKPKGGQPAWKNRKRVIFWSLYFCAFCIMYIMIFGDDTRINETIVLGCFGLAMSVIGVYVAGASWSDISLEKIKNERMSNAIEEPTVIQLTEEDGR